MLSDTLTVYVKKNYPEIIKEYNRYTNRNELPAVGDIVITLTSGFGGYAGLYRRVKEFRDNNIIISGDGRDYIVNVEEWYKKIEVIK